ncbi:MAG: helix-turn-helix domain-containing protein [Planctomycetes bacterium]|nr:helix-turn-helix domain-containing protein [Planctomycetota bacterium]MBM4085393.1 helix-turn-helix domain-containing protein [Planctomycetota bacterium]
MAHSPVPHVYLLGLDSVRGATVESWTAKQRERPVTDKANPKERSSANLFQELLATIQSLTGLRTVIYDRQQFTMRAGRQAIDAAFAGHRSEFCTLIRGTEAGSKGCTASDVEEATQEAGRRGEPFLHVCHAGLMEVVMPVVYRGEHVATVFCGQAIVEGCPAADVKWLTKRAGELGIGLDHVMPAYEALPRISQEKLVQIGRLLFLALNQLAESESRAALDRALALERNEAVRSAIAYVEEHFRDPLGIEALARHVHLTPAYLSRLFRKTTGMTFTDYLTQRRVAEAKELLRTTAMKVSDVAFEVGYSHQSYLGRKFRQVTGHTPVAYRRANQAETVKPR